MAGGRDGRSSGDAVLAALRLRIDSGDLAGGRLPPERQLADALGTGRRAVRRALDMLESEGVVWRRQGRGTFVGAPPPPAGSIPALAGHDSPQEIMEVRLEVEPVLARLCAARATGAELAALQRTAWRTARAGSAREYEIWDGAFHRKIAEAAGNKLFLALFDAIAEMRAQAGWASLRESTFSRERIPVLAEQHAEIVAAMLDRDTRAAESRMRAHLGTVNSALVGARDG